MQLTHFDTAAVAPAERLALFRRGALHFRVEPVGPPAAFAATWRLLRLGDVNAIHSTISAVRYRRDRAMIQADGEDRIAIHVRVAGEAHGLIDGTQVRAAPGEATVWDLALPLDVGSDDGSEVLILTLPRHMIAEALPGAVLGATLPASAALAAAASQLRWLLDHAEPLPEAGAVHYGRTLRDLFANALLPASRSPSTETDPLLLRICTAIDARPDAPVEEAALAAALAVTPAAIGEAVARMGGLAVVAERRRLLTAYRLLLDPAEAAMVSVIARRCGFTDMSAFSRRFREVFQTSARDLRRFHRGDLPRWAGAYVVEQDYHALKA